MKPRIFCLRPKAAVACAAPAPITERYQIRADGEPTLDRKEAKRRLFLRGISVAEWARNAGFDKHIVDDLLRGRAEGRRGKAYQAAVALGIKDDPLKRAA